MMEWQPIESAVKGPAIVYDTKLGVIPHAFIHSPDMVDYGTYYVNRAYNVTHWMPLPEAPQ